MLNGEGAKAQNPRPLWANQLSQCWLTYIQPLQERLAKLSGGVPFSQDSKLLILLSGKKVSLTTFPCAKITDNVLGSITLSQSSLLRLARNSIPSKSRLVPAAEITQVFIVCDTQSSDWRVPPSFVTTIKVALFELKQPYSIVHCSPRLRSIVHYGVHLTHSS